MPFNYFEAAEHCAAYNQFRVVPPQELVKRIVDYLAEKSSVTLTTAVDIGCGGGQSTRVLAPFFETVIGIDPSYEQITEARNNNTLSNITYKTGSAENIALASNSVQLITAGQACHWFDLDKFYAEAERVLVTGGVIALYGYLLPRPYYGSKGEELCQIVDKCYNVTLGNYVLPESRRVYVENYRGDDFCVIPFVSGAMIRDDSIASEHDATLADLMGYISTWSAFQNYHRIMGRGKAVELLQAVERECLDAIGLRCLPEDVPLKIQYKFFLLMGRKS